MKNHLIVFLFLASSAMRVSAGDTQTTLHSPAMRVTLRTAASEGFSSQAEASFGQFTPRRSAMIHPNALPRPQNARAKRLYPLSDIYLRASRARDYVRAEHMVTNVSIDGSPKSGKSSGPYRTFAIAAMRHRDAALMLCAKDDSAADAERIIRAGDSWGRTIVVSPSSGHSWNPVDYAMRHAPGETTIDEGIAELWSMVEIMNRGEVSRQGDAFFDPGAKQLLRNIMTVQMTRYGFVDIVRVLKCVQFLPRGFEAMEQWQRYPILEDLEEGLARMQAKDADAMDLCASYFKYAIPGLSDKTISSLQITADVKMSPLFSPVMMRMCWKRGTPISPDDIVFGQKVIVLDVPYSQHFAVSRALGSAWKTGVQKACMRRKASHGGSEDELFMVGIFGDEIGCWLTEYDCEAAERGRSNRLYHVFAYQSWATLVDGYGGGPAGETKAERLMGTNFGVRIMCNQISRATRDRNSAMCGSADEEMRSITIAGNGSRSVSTSIQNRPVLREEAFLTLGARNGFVDAFLFLGGPTFEYNGQRYLRVQFRQNGEGRRWMAPFENRPEARPWVGFVEGPALWRAFLNGHEAVLKELGKSIEFWTADALGRGLSREDRDA